MNDRNLYAVLFVVDVVVVVVVVVLVRSVFNAIGGLDSRCLIFRLSVSCSPIHGSTETTQVRAHFGNHSGDRVARCTLHVAPKHTQHPTSYTLLYYHS